MSTLKPIGNSAAGRFFSSLYGAVTAVRNRSFDRTPPSPFPFPIISIGGISAGGTGKTPLTASIAEYLVSIGKTPVLFSRGYGRKSKESLIIPADGTFPEWEQVGDEPAMLRRRIPELWLAIDSKRVRAAQNLLPILPKNAVGIMDDGFQHRAMHRDLDIVTVPAEVGSDLVIPAGLLREPLASLKRADIIVFTGEPSANSLAVLAKLGISAPWGISESVPTHLCRASTGEKSSYLDCELSLFSGIARPGRFFDAAAQFCTKIKNHRIFPDHYVFSPRDIESITSDRESTFCTTEKDWIRIKGIFGKNSAKADNLWYLSITQRFIDSQFSSRVYSLINKCLEHK